MEAALKEGPQHVDRPQLRIAPPLWYHFNHQFRVGGERIEGCQHAGERAVLGALIRRWSPAPRGLRVNRASPPARPMFPEEGAAGDRRGKAAAVARPDEQREFTLAIRYRGGQQRPTQRSATPTQRPLRWSSNTLACGGSTRPR